MPLTGRKLSLQGERANHDGQDGVVLGRTVLPNVQFYIK